MGILIFIYGLIIGSFLNVCIYRIPREESIVFPSSHCPKCGTSLRVIDLIPVFSYLFQRGKCRYCREQISIQYPLIELLNAILYIFIYRYYGLTLEFFFYVVIFSILLVITVIDLKHMVIPDILVVSILIIAIIYKILSFILYANPLNLLNSIGGLVISGLLFLLIILISKGGMGGGDVTLIASLGFIFGVKGILLTIFLSFLTGSVISVILLISRIKTKKDPIPFGPFIVLGFFIANFWGDKLVNWYISKFY